MQMLGQGVTVEKLLQARRNRGEKRPIETLYPLFKNLFMPWSRHRYRCRVQFFKIELYSGVFKSSFAEVKEKF